MLEYQDKTVQEVAACTCDRCQRRMTRDDLDWHKKLSVAFRGGFGSIFGDGRMVSIDLCQQCIKEALGPWLRIESVDEGVFSVISHHPSRQADTLSHSGKANERS